MEIEPKNGTDFTLEECYKHIGCDMVELVNLRDGRILIVDEEGLLKSDFVVNHEASKLARKARASEGIVGNAILCPEEMFK